MSATAVESPHAILVTHGIGQQRPFQTLDHFTGGLFAALKRQGHGLPTITHGKLPPGAPFDHYARVEAGGLTFDIYEYFWASKTVGKASFLDIARWIAATGLTPLTRLAFNLPLLTERARVDAARGPFWTVGLAWQFTRELWRLVYIPVVFIGIALGAAQLVRKTTLLSQSLFNIVLKVTPRPVSLWDVLAAALFLGGVGALLAVAWSLPQQIQAVWRGERWLRDRRHTLLWHLWPAGPPAPTTLVDAMRRVPVVGAMVADWAGRATEERQRENVEIPARRYLLGLSLLAGAVLGGLLWLIAIGRFPWWPSPVVHVVVKELGREDFRRLLWIAGLLVAAVVAKKVFIDYIADIALYATADENSAFFKTRLEILTEMTDKLRWLLRHSRYDTVALVGHSLGSVIAYDAVGRLRVESQIPGNPGGTVKTDQNKATAPVSEQEFKRLTTLVTFGSPLDKIVYFFRAKLPPYERVREHILNELHGFRRRGVRSDTFVHDDHAFRPPDTLRWLNVYSPMDPISAELVFFRDVREVKLWFPLWGKCHTAYWHDQRFYRAVLAALRGDGDWTPEAERLRASADAREADIEHAASMREQRLRLLLNVGSLILLTALALDFAWVIMTALRAR